ncbi:MAG: hypothetical protein JKY81_02295 [Colwellia sp.]|nr:hypothetical protein [Colwellia sp.]
MADIEHKNIADPSIHEPKGVSSATAGQTYIADGAGGGAWTTTSTIAGSVSQGVYDYNDLATASTPITLAISSTPAGATEVTNDAAGASTNTLYSLEGLDDVWLSDTDRFDWQVSDKLALGDTVSIRFDVEFTTTTNDTDVFLWLELGTGGSPYHLPVISATGKKSSGVHKVLEWTGIYMGDTNTLTNEGRVLASADKAGCTLKVNGWFVKVLHTNT